MQPLGTYASPLARRVFVVVNFKGGVGKTMLALNLGAAWAETARRVLLIDLDPSGHLTHALGLGAAAERGHADGSVYRLLSPEERLLPASARTPVASIAQPVAWNTLSLDVLTASPLLRTVPYTIREDGYWGTTLTTGLRTATHDVIVIDCPPETHSVFSTLALDAATDVLVPLQPNGPSVRSAGEMVYFARQVRRDRPVTIRLIPNMFDARTRLATTMTRSIISTYGEMVCEPGLPRMSRIEEAMSMRSPVTVYEPNGPAARAVRALATELLGAKQVRVDSAS